MLQIDRVIDPSRHRVRSLSASEAGILNPLIAEGPSGTTTRAGRPHGPLHGLHERPPRRGAAAARQQGRREPGGSGASTRPHAADQLC